MYDVLDFDHQGRGIIKIDNKVTFVDGAIKGEVIEIENLIEHKKYSTAKLKKVIESSDSRRKPMCKYYGACGGCDLMHIEYEKQLEYKKEKVKNIFKKYLNIEIEPNIIASDNELHYRNKITLHSKNNKTGFYMNKSEDIIYIDECLIANNAINKLLPLENSEKDIILRTNNIDVISNILPKSELIKEISGYKFYINVNSFFQVNDFICSKLFEQVDDFVNENDVVLDLYSGVGTLSVVAAKKAKKVYSVEINKSSYEDSLKSIELNNIKNIETYCMPAEKFVLDFKNKFNSLIVDPPRSGLDKETIEFINESEVSKILYISCDPLSLVRDLKLLRDNYNFNKVELLDMFPNTHHVETVVFMSRFGKECVKNQ